MNVLKAIIFDMDGVLVDSTKYIFEAFNILLSSYNVKLTKQDYQSYLGRSLRDYLGLFHDKYGIVVEDVEFFGKSYVMLS